MVPPDQAPELPSPVFRITPRSLSQSINPSMKQQSELSRKTSISFTPFSAKLSPSHVQQHQPQLSDQQALTSSQSQPVDLKSAVRSTCHFNKLSIDESISDSLEIEEDDDNYEARRRSYSLSRNRLSRCFTEPPSQPYSSPRKRSSIWSSLEDSLHAQESPNGAIRVREEVYSPVESPCPSSRQSVQNVSVMDFESIRASMQRRRTRRSTTSFRSSDLPLSPSAGLSHSSFQSIDSPQAAVRCLDQSFDVTDEEASLAQSPEQSLRSLNPSTNQSPSKDYDRVLRASRRRHFTASEILSVPQPLLRTISSPIDNQRTLNPSASQKLMKSPDMHRCRSSTHPSDNLSIRSMQGEQDHFNRSMAGLQILELPEEPSPKSDDKYSTDQFTSLDFELPSAPSALQPRRLAFADQSK